MVSSTASKRITPAWPALLLLGPVVVLAAVGLYSLRQDRWLVEQEARSQADLLAASLARELQGELQHELGDYLEAAEAWQSRWDTSPPGGQPPSETSRSFGGVVERWEQAHPSLLWADLPQAVCHAEGDRWVDPPDYPELPMPPAWWASAAPALVGRWQDVWTALPVDEPGPATALLEELSTHPVEDWAALARFHQVRLASTSAENKVRAFLDLAREFPSQLTESGMPLADLALIQAVKAAASRAVLREVAGEVARRLALSPSMFSSRLLDELEAQAEALDPSWTRTVGEWRSLLQSADRARELLRQLPASNDPGPDPTEVTLETGRFYVVVTRRKGGAAESVAAGETSPKRTMATIIPLALVEEAMQRVLTRARPAWPAYLGISAVVGQSPSEPPVTNLAGAEGQSTLGQRVKPGSAGDALGDAPELLVRRTVLSAVDELALPFTVSVVLADRAALFARQRQRTWIFGGLVLAAAGVAALGGGLMQRNLAQQLRLNEAKSNFVSSVSHELRAPIASVRLLAEGLERGRVPEPARQQEYFRFIVQECRRLSALVENVLDVSRIEQGRKQYELELLDLGALVEATVKLMLPYATEQGCVLRLVPDSSADADHREGLLCTGDGPALQQALVNLIDNAVKHSPKGGTVSVGIYRSNRSYRTHETHASLSLFVEDQGEGIPAEEHARIFERFYRCGSELRRETPGVGIGLSIVKHVAEAHGGRVLVRSAPGAGSRVTIELPWNES